MFGGTCTITILYFRVSCNALIPEAADQNSKDKKYVSIIVSTIFGGFSRGAWIASTAADWGAWLDTLGIGALGLGTAVLGPLGVGTNEPARKWPGKMGLGATLSSSITAMYTKIRKKKKRNWTITSAGQCCAWKGYAATYIF